MEGSKKRSFFTIVDPSREIPTVVKKRCLVARLSCQAIGEIKNLTPFSEEYVQVTTQFLARHSVLASLLDTSCILLKKII